MGCGQTKASAPAKVDDKAKSTLLDGQQPQKAGIFDSMGGIAGLKAELDKLSVEELSAKLMEMPEDVRTKIVAVVNAPVPLSTSTLLTDLGGKSAIEKLSVDELRTIFQNNPEASKKLQEVLGTTSSVDAAQKEESALVATAAPEADKAETLPEAVAPEAEKVMEEPVEAPLPAAATKKGFFSCCSGAADTENEIVVAK